MKDSGPNGKTPSRRKFYISAKITFWVGFSLIISLLAYAAFTLAYNYFEQSKTAGVIMYGISVLRDVTLVICSILGTTFLTGRMIEVRSKNDLYENLITNDFWGTPLFYRNLNDETKEKILSSLEKEIVFKSNEQIESMYRNIKEKLQHLNQEDYYYEDCSYKISCKIKSDRIEKSITRTVRMRSYKPEIEIENLPIVVWSGQDLNLMGVQPFTFYHATLNGKGIDPENTATEDMDICTYSGVDTGYQKRKRQIYKPKIKLFSNKDTVFSVSYCTVTPVDDIVYTCRVQVPSRKFSVDYQIQNSEEYRVSGRAFGFIDAAGQSPIMEFDNQVSLTFNDWIFPDDGVVIAFTRKGHQDNV